MVIHEISALIKGLWQDTILQLAAQSPGQNLLRDIKTVIIATTNLKR